MSKALRDVYGQALVKYGKDNEEIIVLDADVSGSTRSSIFAAEYPDRFLNVGIAESNMVAMAAGLSTVGKIPFVNTFAVFLTSIGLIAARTFGSYSKLNIKMVGAYGGMSNAYDGPSHHSIEDLAIMRALPNFQVFVASDEQQTDWLVKNAIEVNGPMYIRLTRGATAVKYSPNFIFNSGKGCVLRDGKDATIIACGVMVDEALIAADELSSEGINVRVIDMFTIKPIDRELILDSANRTKAIITCEEHNIIGGLGSAVAEVLSSAGAKTPQTFIGLKDTHGETGDYTSLFKKYGLDASAIIEAVKNNI